MPKVQTPMHIPRDTWVEITANDVTNITFQILSGRVEILRGAEIPPADDASGWIYATGTGERNLPLDQLSHAPGGRVWMRALSTSGAKVLIDHA